ncbi:tigger transposable element-derived protein 1-like [Palaemon carinicauda]|uniref:tigger transposable element-derived protein 1-like n=1 Tax=Palaemon carinicauda TaxID=392227 RepID=UPI0035B58D29
MDHEPKFPPSAPEKASATFGDLVSAQAKYDAGKGTSKQAPLKFKASQGWFEKFKRQSSIHLVVHHGEAASSDMKATNDFVKTFDELTVQEGYSLQQVFNCDKTGFSWKKMPCRTFITAEEKKLPRHKPMKDRVTLALCANPSGDIKVKPLLVYHSKTPRVFKANTEINEKLLLMWRSNAKAWVTRSLFAKYFKINESTNLAHREVWKEHFDVVICLKIIDTAWQEVSRQTLNSASKKLWPDAVSA